MAEISQLLGFAFTNADLLLEVGRDGKIVFALGAVTPFAGKADVMGQPIARLFEPADGAKLATYLHALGPGGRTGTLKFRLSGGKDVDVALCRLPQNNGRISCTLSHIGKRASFGGQEKDATTGLVTRDSFMAAAEGVADDDDTLSLVDVPGLPEACAKLPPAEAEKLMQTIGQSLAGGDIKLAGRIGNSQFGAIGPANGSVQKISERIGEVLKAGGIDSADVEAKLVSLKGQDLSSEQRMLAVRYALSQFSDPRSRSAMAEDAASAFETMLDETRKRALALTQTVADGNFSLKFQPVKHLLNGKTMHFEALTRFADTDNTGETIHFAEQLGIADAFDLAVTIKVKHIVDQGDMTGPAIAVNLSGNTLSSSTAFGVIAGILAKKRALSKRILIEVTDTAAIQDLNDTNLAIQTLRELGYRVGLDGFGGSTASFNYLHAFTIDFVKFDSALTRKLGTSDRDDALISGLIKLCAELNVETIAGGIETAEMYQQARSAGFDLGQGFHLGQPVADLPATESAKAPAGTPPKVTQRA